MVNHPSPSSYDVALVDYDPVPFELTGPILAEMERVLAQAGAKMRLAQCRSEAEVLAFAEQSDLVMIQSVRALLSGPVIQRLACRAIIRMGLGYDSVDVAAASARGILVSNIVDWCNDEVAEHAVALLLAGLRRIAPLNQVLQNGQWRREAALPIRRIHGQTLGLIGFGRIGQAVASRMLPFGVQVLVADPHVSAKLAGRWQARLVSLPELLAQADLISIHARLTPQTHHLLGPAEFAQVKPGAFLVNTARGPIVDTNALVAALSAGRLSGAALDVMESEPLPPDFPLLGMDNVILTPHMASYSRQATAELYVKSAQTAAQLLAQRWAPTIVNPEARPAAETRWGRYTG